MDGLFVCSHRGPLSYTEVDGRVEARRGSGGLVTALSALMRQGTDVTWLACAQSALDREVARGRRDAGGHGDLRVRLLDIPDELHGPFYGDACVTGLGFLFHGLVDQAYTPLHDARFRRGWDAYREVNRRYAQAARSAAGRPVLVEDYHLMFVADELRASGRTATGPLAYFHHVPWCPPAYFSLLPAPLRIEILSRLLAHDTIGFHARRWADAFLACCEAYLPEARCEPDAVRWRDREVSLVVAPAQLDVDHIREVTHGPAADRWRQRIGRGTQGRRTIVRVDRVDLWKNIVRGFLAFEELRAEADDVVHVAVLSESRMHLPQYREYFAACVREADRINRRFAPGGAGPIHVLLEGQAEYSRSLAALSLADVVLVNSTTDGLNLVAKESVLAGQGRSRLVLSETTGVYEEIGRWTHGVHPFDIEQTAAAMAEALRADAPDPELAAAVGRNSPQEWIRRRLGIPA